MSIEEIAHAYNPTEAARPLVRSSPSAPPLKEMQMGLVERNGPAGDQGSVAAGVGVARLSSSKVVSLHAVSLNPDGKGMARRARTACLRGHVAGCVHRFPLREGWT